MKKKKLLLILFLSLFILFTISGAGYFAVARGIPTIDEIKEQKTYRGTKVFANDNVLIGEITIERGIHISIKDLPRHVIDAVVATEDERFWRHGGIDYIAIARALINDIIHAEIRQGGSTITQQLAKVMFLSPERTISRKLKEAVLALRLEKNMTKEEILEQYLNRVYFGHGAYGIEMASRIYFGKSARQLKLHEAALLAGLIRAPALYSPYNNIVRARERQLYVLQRMRDAGFITKDEFEKASASPVEISGSKSEIFINHYFLDYVKKYLISKYGEDMVYKGGLMVYTTLDRQMQLAAYKALRAGLREIDKRKGWRGIVAHKDIDVDKELANKDREITIEYSPSSEDVVTGLVLKVSSDKAIIKAKGLIGTLSLKDAEWARVQYNPKTNTSKIVEKFNLQSILKQGDIVYVRLKAPVNRKSAPEFVLEQEPEVEGAVVAIEPYTGFIKAMVGGFDYSRSEFNRAIYARRQPGSAFKPVIYAAALDNGFTQASIIVDEPVVFDEEKETEWSPKNFDGKYWGPTILIDALAYSRNVITVKLVESIGIQKVIDFARQLGINSEMPRDYSLSLGSLSISPLELTQVYATFASNGMRITPLGVRYIIDGSGRIIEENQPVPEEAISPQTSFLITSMMKNVVAYGTGWRAKELGRPVAGKTGTTNEYRDAWFIGYTPNLVAGVWIGYDDMRPIGEHETGARAALPVWLNFMKSIDLGEPEDFPVPEGIVARYVDRTTGLLADHEGTGIILGYFKEGTEPRDYAPLPEERINEPLRPAEPGPFRPEYD
ncbi:MAG: PBP1A family penicillin-binding protein [Thermodesulfovibrionales bacterium]|nr:PBP1A family penicillin-binding protein [Thermodesulfovibrionales bacterium]